jgi:hypothetical protein
MIKIFTQKKINKIKKEAYEEGFKDGHDVASREAYEEGYAAAKEEPCEEEKDYEKGYDEGHEAGHDEGYEEGYEQGSEDKERKIGVVEKAKQEREIKLNYTFEECWHCFAWPGVFNVVDVRTGEVFGCEDSDDPEWKMWKSLGPPEYIKITERAESFEQVVEMMKKYHLVPEDGYPSPEKLRQIKEKFEEEAKRRSKEG